jgi:hypothetical protein
VADVSRQTPAEAFTEFNATMRTLPFAERLFVAYVITLPAWCLLWPYGEWPQRMPPWYQDTLIQVGDWILATWRRVKR